MRSAWFEAVQAVQAVIALVVDRMDLQARSGLAIEQLLDRGGADGWLGGCEP